ncbi:PKD domain-containing protein [Methanosarcina sp.]|uniref:PKD domain-containing protein n=1 Tax=Methanosarcina sp. TaxID=2213 RepID=UPI003BB51C7D
MCLTGTASAVDIPAGYVSGYSLNSAGTTYILRGNILANTTAFSIEANDIVFDGNGYTINCGLTGAGVGITSKTHSNITIKNVRIIQHNSSTSSHGIFTQNTAKTIISNCSVSSKAGYGIYTTGSTATVDRCKTSSFKGISLYLVANNSSVTNCSAVSNSNYAICLANANNNRMSNCTGRTNTSCGIDFTKSNNNNVFNCAGYSNTHHGLSFTTCTKNIVRTSIGYTNSSTGGSGISLINSSKNTFINSTGSSYLKFGIKLTGNTTHNTFTNCIGESFGRKSIYQGIWFIFSSAECSGTNIYTNCTSRSVLATTCTDSNKSTWLAMGDSITAGGAAGIPYGAYIHYANASLWNKGYVFFNAGLGGETAASGRARFLDEMAVFNPKYVTIMYGANDLKFMRSQKSIIDDILWMASQAKAHGATPIILLTSVRRGAVMNTTYLDQNLSTQALDAGYNVFNVYDIIDTIPNNSQYDEYNSTNYVDSVHPTQAANKLIGDALANYIITLNSQESLKPSANFSANVSSGYVPLCVQFMDLSKNATSWNWNFGDGTNSTLKNPIHEYTKTGIYTVTLTVTNSAGNNTITKSSYIKVMALKQKPVISFWGSRTSGTAPLTIGFTDASTGSPTAWKWDFGDGTYSTQKKPKHIYSKAGTYSVKLTASNAAGSGTKIRSNYIKVT